MHWPPVYDPMRKDMKASDYRQHAQYCRDLAKHTPPGEPREELLEIAKTWETLALEKPEWVQQHRELTPESTRTRMRLAASSRLGGRPGLLWCTARARSTARRRRKREGRGSSLLCPS